MGDDDAKSDIIPPDTHAVDGDVPANVSVNDQQMETEIGMKMDEYEDPFAVLEGSTGDENGDGREEARREEPTTAGAGATTSMIQNDLMTMDTNVAVAAPNQAIVGDVTDDDISYEDDPDDDGDGDEESQASSVTATSVLVDTNTDTPATVTICTAPQAETNVINIIEPIEHESESLVDFDANVNGNVDETLEEEEVEVAKANEENKQIGDIDVAVDVGQITQPPQPTFTLTSTSISDSKVDESAVTGDLLEPSAIEVVEPIVASASELGSTDVLESTDTNATPDALNVDEVTNNVSDGKPTFEEVIPAHAIATEEHLFFSAEEGSDADAGACAEMNNKDNNIGAFEELKPHHENVFTEEKKHGSPSPQPQTHFETVADANATATKTDDNFGVVFDEPVASTEENAIEAGGAVESGDNFGMFKNTCTDTVDEITPPDTLNVESPDDFGGKRISIDDVDGIGDTNEATSVLDTNKEDNIKDDFSGFQDPGDDTRGCDGEATTFSEIEGPEEGAQVNPVPPGEDDGENDCGNFKESEEEHQPIPLLPEADDDFGDFEEPEEGQKQLDSVLGDHGDLKDSEEMPSASPVLPQTDNVNKTEDEQESSPVSPQGDNLIEGPEEGVQVNLVPPGEDNGENNFGNFKESEEEHQHIPVLPQADDVEDDFGHFEAPEEGQTQLNSVHDDHDDFKNSEEMPSASPENKQESSPVSPQGENVIEDFSNFEDPVKEQIQPVEEANDSGDFEEIEKVQGASLVLPQVDNVEDDDFGDFEEPEEKQHASSIPPQLDNVEDDDFGDFEDRGEEQHHCLEPPQADNVEDDDFGDFEEPEPSPVAPEVDNVEDDDFGNFEEPEEQQHASPGSVLSGDVEDDGFGGFEDPGEEQHHSLEPPQADNVEDDDFGDFEETEPSPTAPEVDNVEDDDFGNFEEPEEQQEDCPGSALPEDDDFGDFEDPGEEQYASPVLPQLDNVQDDFGAFEETEPSPIASEVDNAEDDDFGDFEEPEEQHDANPGSALSDNAEDDDFGDFEEPEEEQSQMNRAEDDFGDFEESAINTQDSEEPSKLNNQENIFQRIFAKYEVNKHEPDEKMELEFVPLKSILASLPSSVSSDLDLVEAKNYHVQKISDHTVMGESPSNIFIDYHRQIDRYGYFNHHSFSYLKEEQRSETGSLDAYDMPPELPPCSVDAHRSEENGEKENNNDPVTDLSQRQNDASFQPTFACLNENDKDEDSNDTENDEASNQPTLMTPTMVQLPPAKKKSTIASVEEPLNSSPVDDSFGDFEGTTEIPTSPKSGSVTKLNADAIEKSSAVEDDDFGDFHASFEQGNNKEVDQYSDPFANVDILTPVPIENHNILTPEKTESYGFGGMKPTLDEINKEGSKNGDEDMAADESFGSFQSISNGSKCDEFSEFHNVDMEQTDGNKLCVEFPPQMLDAPPPPPLPSENVEDPPMSGNPVTLSDFNDVETDPPPQTDLSGDDKLRVEFPQTSDSSLPSSPPPPSFPSETYNDAFINDNTMALGTDPSTDILSNHQLTSEPESFAESMNNEEGLTSRQDFSTNQLESNTSFHTPLEMHESSGSHGTPSITPTTSQQSFQNANISSMPATSETEAAIPNDKPHGCNQESEVEHDDDFGDFQASFNQNNDQDDPFNNVNILTPMPTEVCTTSHTSIDKGEAKLSISSVQGGEALHTPSINEMQENAFVEDTSSNSIENRFQITPASSHQSLHNENVHANDHGDKNHLTQGNNTAVKSNQSPIIANDNNGMNEDFDDDDDDEFGDFHDPDPISQPQMTGFREPDVYVDPFSSVNVLNPTPMAVSAPQPSGAFSHASEPSPSPFDQLHETAGHTSNQMMNVQSMQDSYNISNSVDISLSQSPTSQNQIDAQSKADPFANMVELKPHSLSQQSFVGGTTMSSTPIHTAFGDGASEAVNGGHLLATDTTYRSTPTAAAIGTCASTDDDDFGDFCDAGAQSIGGSATLNGVMRSPSENAITDAFSVFD